MSFESDSGSSSFWSLACSSVGFSSLGSYEGEKVYNYNLNVNVKSDANPQDIARVVMTQIRQVDSQRIRTQRG